MLQMANKLRLSYPRIMMLLLTTWRESLLCSGLEVHPPEDLAVLDPGHLGLLEITWSPPRSLINMTECIIMYHLDYYNTYRDKWDAVRTVFRTYSAQFNLMKDVNVRVYTVLDGPCTNNTTIKSTNYTELIQKPPSAVQDTAVLDFICVFHNMEFMECKWKRSPKTPANSQRSLYFWHKSLERAAECPKYIMAGGVRSGCTFSEKSLPLFTDINFCVNGSSLEGHLKPTFITLQIQNHVKAAATEVLHLRAGPDRQLELTWEEPAGNVPGHCLEWEVEHSQEGPDGEIVSKRITTKQTSLTLPSSPRKKTSCFRVRSKLNNYCVDKGFWSDWSHQICSPVSEIFTTPEPELDMKPLYIYIAVAIITTLVLSLCVWLAVKMRNSRQEKKLYSLLTLFTRNTILSHTEPCKGKEMCPGTII
ncbi:interleukin-13 receptor subunit alpha-2 isoform 2-T2 [Odontesthes bonariensis]|uniref:interleukin-13 receptor subunit alpha-2 isoform X2 n=1 Tax=Odontesthes bonariensis TaxID=219752 RepID=UPI003F583FDB